tara:strand:+ start:2478 stop:6173 length:3696 start_codon:yes stop_codon:yes gene_type:complete
MKKNYSILIAVLLFFNLSLYSQNGPPWDFNGTDHGFVAQNYASLTVGDTYVTFTLTDADGDGDAESPNSNFRNLDAGIDTSLGSFIAITMKNETANNKMQAILGSPGAGCGCYVNFETLTANDADFVTHYINVGANSNWTGTISEIIFRFKKGNGVNNQTFAGDILIDHIEIVESIPATSRIDYTFDDTSDSEGFSGVNGITLTQPVAGELHLDIAAQSPYPKLEQTGLYSVDADTYKYVQVTLVNNSPKNKLTFVSPNGGNEFSTADMTANSTDAQTYELDLTTLTNWNGNQANWWLQLVENPGDGPVASAGIIDIQQILFATESINPSQANVTFTVNTANITVGDNGMYLGGGVFGGAQGQAMSDDDGDGTWEVTVAMDAGTTGNYTFLNSPNDDSDWGAKENLEGQDCADPANYNDRILPAIDGDMTIQHCFGSCESDGTCPEPAATSDISFSVDMSNYPAGLGADDTVYLNGNFNGWCGECNPMSDDDGDGIWTLTLPFEDGNYEYKFTVNGWNSQEDFTEVIEGCTVTDGTYTNRGLTVAGEDMTLPTVYWNLCPGESPGNFYTVTFEVNTSAIIGGVGANGLFAGGGVLGNAQAIQLLDDDGDGVYVGSVSLEAGTTGNYIFLNSPNDGGDWGAKENLEGQDCADPANYNDRILPEVTSDVTYLYCFGECSGDGTGECPSDTVTYNLTMTVNTANITVGENGMYLGGGVFGGANAYEMLDDDNDGTWEVTVEVAEGTAGNYTFLNSPTSSSDWDAKENIEGQSCADPANYNDRILEAVTADTTLMHCFASCETDGSCPDGNVGMMLQGIIDFTVPEGGSNGKAIHLYVDQDIEDLAVYGIGVANNGGGTDGEEYTFPQGAATAGQHILLVRSVEAMDAYMNASAIFDQVFLDEGGSISQNGDDAIELFYLGGVVETFGDINVDGTGEAWEYLDSWAYKVNGEWTYGAINCTDGSTTTCDSECPYPFAACDTSAGIIEFLMSGNWRSQAEAYGHMGVGPGDSMGADWWNANAWDKVDTGLYDDGWTFTETSMTHDTGDDGAIFGKKPAIDAAFDPDGSNAYDADNGDNEYLYYTLADYTDDYTVDTLGEYVTVTFATVGNIGFYTGTGAQEYQILETGDGFAYFRNVGEDGNSWYNRVTTADYLSTSDSEILDMRIYPNPVNGNFVTILSSIQGLKQIEVYSVTGRKIMDTTINNSTLDVSSFNSGFYMLKVTINGQSKVSKLVIR